jgi:predicted metalloprotease with PDZ domain
MKQILFSCTFIFLAILTKANDGSQGHYTYHLNLNEVIMDRLIVTVETPKVHQKSIRFHFPKIIPGTYTEYDFGRFVHQVNAFDEKGEGLSVVREDVNTWRITPANKLHHLTYEVDDSFDATSGRAVSGMSGTNIEEGKNFLLNGHGFYGYLEGLEFVPFKVEVQKPAEMVHQSAYTTLTSKGNTDWFEAKNYHELVDMPVMYCKPDTAVIKLDKTEVLLAIYSPNGMISSQSLREHFEVLLASQRDYLKGNLPVERYAFLMYFMGEQLPIGTGALEHNYSSVYCLPEMPEERIRPFLLDIASHEFFHIITPLSVHSEEIHYFDFAEPDMSRHLWMYEGITEYFSHHNQVRSGMISPEEFLERMGRKIQLSKANYRDDLSFTKMSQKILDKYEDQYGNVYEKGALLAMCLDIELQEKSGGTYGLVELMQELSKEYGKEKPFKDKKLFAAIEKSQGDKIGDFLNTYIKKGKPVPYGVFFDKMGISYDEPKDTMVYTFGDAAFGFSRETRKLVVQNIYNLNEMGRELGYRVGDEILKIQNKTVPEEGIQQFVDQIRSTMKEGASFTVEVSRKDEKGNDKTVFLEAKIQKAKRVNPPTIKISSEENNGKKKIQEAWLHGRP